MEKKHTLSVLVNNHNGVLTRVTGLFSRRAFNIESLSAGMTEDKNYTRITIMLYCEDETFLQVKNQLAKLVDVIAIKECFPESSVQRELALIKIDSTGEKLALIMQVVDIFRARVIDVSKNTLTLEVTGDTSKITAMLTMLEDYGIKEVIRTGVTAMLRGDDELKNNSN